MIKKILGIGVIAFATISILTCFTKISPGYVGVVYSPNGGIQKKVLTQGWHLVSPLNSVTDYTVSIEQGYLSQDRREGSLGDDSFFIRTSDSKRVNVDLSYSYRFNREMVTKLFTDFRGRSGKEIEHSFMRGNLKTWASEATSKFTLTDLYGKKNEEVNEAILQKVRKEFAPYGIVIEKANLSRVGSDPSTERAIQEKINAQQSLEREKVEKNKAQVSAEKAVVEAEGRKKVAVIQAQAEAEAMSIRAKAISDYNKNISKSITPELIQYNKIKKWNGVVPKIVGTATPMIATDI